jgi:iron(III) transport system permease protein
MRPERVDLGRLRWVAFAFVFVVALLSTLVPGAALVAGSFMTRWGFFSIPQPWTLRNWENVLSDGTFGESVVNSIQLGVLSAIVATVVVFIVAVVLVRTSFRGRSLLDFVTWLPWGVPGVLLSLGILAAVLGIPALRFLHGSMALLIVAVVLFRFPLGVHLIRTGLLQLGRELEEASYVAGARWWYTQLRITVAILMPVLVAVALIVLITALNEVSGVVLLASTDTRTLSLLSLDYLTGSPSDRESAAVVIVIVSMLAIGIALFARILGVRLGGGGLT